MDAYDDLPDYTGGGLCGHIGIDSNWRSPFIGKTIEEAAEFIANAPMPSKALNRNFFAVFDKAQYDATGQVIICKTPNPAVGREEVQKIPCYAGKVALFFVGFEEDSWRFVWAEQGI